MELVPGFVQLLQPLVSTKTVPTFESLITVLTGWVFAGRRTVTRMILAAGDAAEKHYSSYHRVFSAARWSLDATESNFKSPSLCADSSSAVRKTENGYEEGCARGGSWTPGCSSTSRRETGKPSRKPEAAAQLQAEFAVSERRACQDDRSAAEQSALPAATTRR